MSVSVCDFKEKAGEREGEGDEETRRPIAWKMRRDEEIGTSRCTVVITRPLLGLARD